MLLIPLTLITFATQFTHIRLYWFFLGFYFLAKVFEMFDHQIYQLLSGMSGHLIKHVLPSAGCLVFLYQIKIRKVLS